MESKHNIYIMTIVQVLTQQVERVNDLESEVKDKGELIKQAEVDLNMTKETLIKEKECLEEKGKAFDNLITAQKQKAVEESKLVEELKFIKGMISKAQEDIESKNNLLNAELKNMKEASTQTVSDRNEVSNKTTSKLNEILNVNEEENEAKIKEKKIPIPGKYFNRIKGCRRGKKCWFYHDDIHEANKKTKVQQKPNKNKNVHVPKMQHNTSKIF